MPLCLKPLVGYNITDNVKWKPILYIYINTQVFLHYFGYIKGWVHPNNNKHHSFTHKHYSGRHNKDKLYFWIWVNMLFNPRILLMIYCVVFLKGWKNINMIMLWILMAQQLSCVRYCNKTNLSIFNTWEVIIGLLFPAAWCLIFIVM